MKGLAGVNGTQSAIDVYSKLAQAEAEVREGKVSDAREGLRTLREKYGL